MSNLIILGGGLPRSRSLGRGLHDRLGPPSANDPLAGQRDEAAKQHPIDLSPRRDKQGNLRRNARPGRRSAGPGRDAVRIRDEIVDNLIGKGR